MFRLCSSIVRVAANNNLSQQSTSKLSLPKSVPVIRSKIVADHYRSLRTSTCHRTPKLIVLFIRPIASAISGRLFRWWWQRRNETERLKYLNWFVRNKVPILSVVGFYFGSLVVYYICNVEETPITGRRRFMAFTNDQLEQVNKQASASMTQEYQAMDLTHPYVKLVVNTAKRIVRANRDIEQFKGIEWRVSVFDEPGLLNAMVNADGQIIVFKEMIEQCATDDELAVILSHEMAHAILNHVAEKLSKSWLVGFFTAPLLFLIWAVSPTDISAAIFTYLQNIVMNVTLNFPYERDIESEADTVGLRLAAKACVDVRQAVSFFKRMEMMEKEELPTGAEIPSVIEYLSTHPTHEKRWKFMERQLESALKLREECNCEPLGPLPKELTKYLILEKERDQAIHIRII
ncbi:metalloendopeptidase OMA1, mitochondrial-like [Bradysia coprophila]|uniref:metalloendopeptidase OMA1, mitochondrial-like n=1 Tax=Bradysia coprophila TaxID=38358 RepID=UPI00187DA3CF|nr:metalloendopeptidase OMA1, mitochondrial-like [Bradysia coprophila]